MVSIALIFNILGEYAVGWRTYLGMSLTALSTLLLSLILSRINHITLRRRLPDRIDWQLLLAVQLLGVIAALDSLRQSDTPIVLLGHFCAPLWLGGISLFLFRKIILNSSAKRNRSTGLPTFHFKLNQNINDTSKYHSQRRAEYPSVSEDFRCRDPFAGPLGASQIPMVLSTRSSDARMEMLRPSSMFLDLDLSPKAKDLRPEFCRLNTKASRPTTGDTSQGGSFHTAEVYLDTEPEYQELSGSPRKGGSSTKWLIPKDALDSLPSIPAPAHMPISMNPSRHARNRPGIEVPAELAFPPPTKIPELSTRPSHRSLLSTLHPPPVPPSAWAELAEVHDRTPTQSLYLSSTSLNIAIASGDTGRIPLAIPLDAPTSGGNTRPHSRTPSICSLPSIPSTPNTPEQTFGTELSEELVEDSLNTDALRDSLFLPGSLTKKDEDESMGQRASVGTFL